MKKIIRMGLCFLVGVGVFAEQVAEIDTATAYSVEQITDEGSIGILHEEFIFNFMPIIPPAPSEMFLQPIGRPIVFDASTFKRRFLSNLIGEMHPVSGAPIYTVYTMEDASSSEIVIFNENLLELARISRPKTYRPFSWAETKFGAELTPELMALYNPARMIAEYKLIPIDYADYHIAALEQQAALESATVSMAMAPVESDGVSIRMAVVPVAAALTESEEPLMAMASSPPPPPDGGTNSPPAGSGGGSSNLVMELAITMPLDCGPYVEIFQKQNLVYPQLWNVAVNKMAVTGSVETIWADPASSNAATMFYIVGDTSAGFDDGDGYSELRERHVENSNPFVFDFRDTDGDGLHDWFEIMNFGGSITNQSGTDDFDGDSLANNVEMVLHPAEGTNSAYVTFSSDPSLTDTDGDGTDDGSEVAQGSDPSDPDDGGLPPEPPAITAVTLFVHDRSPGYLEGGYTMKLSDGDTTHKISCTGQEAVSNTFNVASGRSYMITLTSKDFPPYTGAYTATISGNGLVIEDPENILGVHNDNNTEIDLSYGKDATVHVMKIGFNLNPVKVGLGEDRTSETEAYPATTSATYPHRLIAMITPKVASDAVTFESSKLESATVAEAPRTEVGDATQVVLEVAGVSATPAGSPDGDAEIRAKINNATCSTTKAVVIKPMTRTHSVGTATLVNSAYLQPTNSGSVVKTKVMSMVTITIKDQFGQILHGIYNGSDLVVEKFSDIEVTGDVSFPDQWVPINEPDNKLIDGIKLDEVSLEIAYPINPLLTPPQITEWENGNLFLGGRNNVFSMYDSIGVETPTAEGDMEVKVDGHAVTPSFNRKIISVGNNHPPVPFTVTDTVE